MCFTFVFLKVTVNVSAKVSTLIHSKIFGVTFEVLKFLSARTSGKTNFSTLSFDYLPKVTENGHL